ncbi:MAG: hypothetical protein ACREUU_07965 [Gammaproteobacteria bacterium]
MIKFNRWAKLPEIDRMLERAARWTLTFPWRPPGILIAKAPVKGAPGSALAICQNLRLMHYAFAKSGDPLFLAAPRKSLEEAFRSHTLRIATRSTGTVYNYLPWFLTTLKNNGNPEFETALEVATDGAGMQVARGQRASVTLRIRNRGATAVESATFSFQPRLDFRVTASSAPPNTIAPGQTREIRYEIQAPERINLTSESSRMSYAQFSGLYRRAGKTYVTHLPVQITVSE